MGLGGVCFPVESSDQIPARVAGELKRRWGRRMASGDIKRGKKIKGKKEKG